MPSIGHKRSPSRWHRPADVSKINWKDRAAIRGNLRATVKRITVDASKKHFHAQFLDGREYRLSVEKGIATIESPEGDIERSALALKAA